MSEKNRPDDILRSSIPENSLKIIENPLKEMEIPPDTGSRGHSIPRVRPITGSKELPLFIIAEGIDCQEGPGEITVLCRSSRFQEYIRETAGDTTRPSPEAPPDGASAALFRKDGTLLRHIPLPGDVRFAAARGNRIYGFRRDSDCILMDLEGNPVPLPWKDWPREDYVYDLSADGRFLLYLEKRFPTQPHLPELRIKDLETGDETIFPSYFTPGDPPRFLDGGRVFVPQILHKKSIGCYDTRTGEELFRLLDTFCECFDVDSDRGLLVAGAKRTTKKHKKITWEVFNTEGKHLHSWEEDCSGITGFLKIPHRSLIVYIVKKSIPPLSPEQFAIRARDYLTGQVILDEPLPGQAIPCARPDGRAIYAADSTGILAQYALEYDFPK